MKAAVRLPSRFDPAGLQADLQGIAAGEWITHFNTQYFEGSWTGVSLRAAPDADGTLFHDPTAWEYRETPLLAACPHFAAVLAALPCPFRSVRLLRLAAGSNIREHRDQDLGWEAGEVRLHVPAVTNPGVEFHLDGRRVVMREGECWYLDLSRPHRVQNLGAADRIHLVIDCVLTDPLRALILEAGQAAEDAPDDVPDEPDGFERFRERVLGDPALQALLLQTSDRREFIAATVRAGAEGGCRFTAADVEAALQAARRTWIERWVA